MNEEKHNMEKIYKILKYFLYLISSIVMMLFGSRGLGFDSIIYFINHIKWKITGDISQSIKYLAFFQIVENIISLIGLALFIYTITNILLLLKEEKEIEKDKMY
ncbi:hypothetical protein BIV18_04990 [Peptoniphilus porci]|nr:hypothetical protein BIV18_04990 [Peptoniphilus porci]